MLLSHHQNARQKHYVQIAIRYYENLAEFKYLRMAVINQNFIHEEIKRRLNAHNACYHSVQKLVFFSSVQKHKN
jgi:hypothetical protein